MKVGVVDGQVRRFKLNETKDHRGRVLSRPGDKEHLCAQATRAQPVRPIEDENGGLLRAGLGVEIGAIGARARPLGAFPMASFVSRKMPAHVQFNVRSVDSVALVRLPVHPNVHL